MKIYLFSKYKMLRTNTLKNDSENATQITLNPLMVAVLASVPGLHFRPIFFTKLKIIFKKKKKLKFYRS